MRIEIDSNRVKAWLLGHLAWVIPAGAAFFSWFAAVQSQSNHESNVGVWWCFASVLTGILSAIAGIRAGVSLYDKLD